MYTLRPHAEKHPDKLAVVFADGSRQITYGELEQSSRRIAVALRRLGLRPGDGIALLAANEDFFYDVYWATQRSGLYFTPINYHLSAGEIAYVVENSDAKAFFASASFAAAAAEAAASLPPAISRLSLGGAIEGFRRVDDVLADVSDDAPLDDELEGAHMLYSSGTTGRPKGVRPPFSNRPAGDPSATAAVVGLTVLFGLTPEDRYLSPAPLYHTAPLFFTAAHHRIGATAVVMRRFDAADALRAIERWKTTTSQWVPTMFRRLLALPEAVRRGFDLSSQRLAIHAAAPCPIPTKEAMIEWWGPIIVEYYGGTEGGGTKITSAEWLAHKGSIGRHWIGKRIHILDEEDREVTAPGSEGAVYFEASENPLSRFAYYKDEVKTRESYRGNLFTLGDVGYLDDEGYLYLTDRKSNMIISGGVNIYPQETENVLAAHAKVDDVAVIGVPNDDLGEEVKAVVVPTADAVAGAGLERELIDYCRERMAHYKCPRSVDFATDLPRQPTGKLYKRLIREKYWQGRGGRLV